MEDRGSRGLALVILAAGESRRLGLCKALAAITPRNPLELLCAAGEALAGPPALIVTGADHAAIAAAAPIGTEVLENPAWRTGRSGGAILAASLRSGFDLCLAPVDVPLVPQAVFESLRRGWEDAGSPARGWLSPWIRGPSDRVRLHGHPVVVGRGLILELAPPEPLRALRERSDPLLAVEVASRAILDDLDTPEDLERLRLRSRA